MEFNFSKKPIRCRVNWALKRWQAILLFLYGLTPLLWFKDKYMFRPEEEGYLNYNYLYEKFFYSWSSHLASGGPVSQTNHIILYPVGIFYEIASFLAIPNYIIQRLFIVLIFYIIIYSIYKLIYYFTKDKSISFLSVLFYTLTFYSLTAIFYTAKMFQLFLMPLFFYLFVRYLETKRIVYLALNFIVVFTFQAIFCNFPTAVATFFVYFIALIYYYTTQVNLNKIVKDIKYIFYFLFTFVPTFFYVFIVYYFSVVYGKGYNEIRVTTSFGALNFIVSKLVKVFQLFRGVWWEPQSMYNPWAYFFDNPIIITISFVLFGFIFLGLFKAKQNNKLKKQYSFWLVVLVSFIFLTLGAGEPFGFIYKWMFDNIPFFYIFREPWAKFIPLVVLSSTILFAYTLKILRDYKKLVYPIILILVLIHGSLFFTNNIFNHKNPGPWGTDVLFPQYWLEAQVWSKNHKNDNVIAIPYYYNYWHYHEWYKNQLGNLNNINGSLPFIFLYTNIINNGKSGSPIDKYIAFENFNPKFLPLWNVRYILNQNDIVEAENDKTTVAVEDLQKDGVISSEPYKTFGKLDLYEVSAQYFLPRVYASCSPLFAEAGVDYLPSLAKAGSLDEKPAIFLSEQNPELKVAYLTRLGFRDRKKAEPKIEFKEVNPTRYVVKVSEAHDSFWLVLSQNHHPYWKAYIKQNSKLKTQNSKLIEKSALLSALIDVGKRSRVKEHYLVNGYANGWYVEPNELQDFEIILEYWPQRLFETAWSISALALIGSVVYLGNDYSKRKWCGIRPSNKI